MYYRNGSYKTAIEYYKEPVKHDIKYSQYKGPIQFVQAKNTPQIKESYETEKLVPNRKTHKEPVHMKWKTSNYTNMSDPKVWGSSFWFTLHNGAAKYPISASPITRDRMKGYILGIPSMLPCAACQIHANNHIEKIKHLLNDIVSGRDKLFKFFVDFHNIVNKRYNKPEMSYERAYEIYDRGVDVSVMEYS